MNDQLPGDRLERVIWIDPTSKDGWHDVEETTDFATNKVWRVKSVGFVVHEDDDSITLAATLNLERTYALQLVRIPKGVILARMELTAATPRREL